MEFWQLGYTVSISFRLTVQLCDCFHHLCGHAIIVLRPPRGVWEACLHQFHRPCASGAIQSQTYWMELVQCHKVCEIGGDELHRPPMVALTWSNCYLATL